MRKTTFAITLAALLAGTIADARLRSQAQSAPPAEEVPAPTHWVPFAADFEKTQPGAPGRIVGRFFRSSDGSERTETHVSLDGRSWSLIDIVNIASNTYYEKSRDGDWCSHPMRLPRRGYHPPRMSKTTFGLMAVSEKIGGFEVYRLAGRSRVIELVAPQLNFFALVMETPNTGTRQAHYNIQPGEQLPDLFVPPPGVDVAAHSGLRGIVESRPGEPEITLKDLKEHK